MNWMRTILDGFAMAAYFNLFAAAVALYNPRLMFPSYPPAIIKNAPEPPSKAENRFYWLWIFFGELLPLLLHGAVSMVEGGTHGFWQMALTGYSQWMMINLCDLFFLDIFLIQKRAKRRFVIPGTEGHPGYGVQSVDEKLRIAGASVAMAIDPVSPDGGGAGRDRSIVDEIINIEEIM